MFSKEFIGLRVKEARESYSKKIGIEFTQKDLAHKTGISRSHINEIENGKVYPSIPNLKNISEACDVPLRWFNSEPVDVPDELKALGIDYIAAAKELKEKGLTPDEIRKLSEIARMFKK